MSAVNQSRQDLANQMELGFSKLEEAQATTQEHLDILIRTVHDMLNRPPQQ